MAAAGASIPDLTRGAGGWRNHAPVYLSLLAVLLLTLRQVYTVPATGLGLSPAYLLALGAGVLWLLGSCLRVAGLPADAHPVRVAVLAQLITQLLGYVTALRSPGTQVTELSQLIPLLILAGLTLATLDTLHTWTDLDTVVRWLVIAGAVAAATALLAKVTGTDVAGLVPPGLVEQEELRQPVPRAGIARVRGTAAHPLEMAAVMTALFPLAMYCMITARHRLQPRLPWIAPVALILAAGTLSVSRSFVVGLATIALVQALRWPLRRTAALLAAALLALVVALLASTDFTVAFGKLFITGSNDNSLDHRAFARGRALDLAAQHPFFGIGAGNADLASFPVLDNQYLGVLLNSGLLGLLGFLAFLLAGIYCALRVPASTGRRGDGKSQRQRQGRHRGAAGLSDAATLKGVVGLIDMAPSLRDPSVAPPPDTVPPVTGPPVTGPPVTGQRRLGRNRKERREAPQAQTTGELATALGSALLALAVINLVLDTAGFQQIVALTAVLVGIAGATYRLAGKQQTTGGGNAVRGSDDRRARSLDSAAGSGGGTR